MNRGSLRLFALVMATSVGAAAIDDPIPWPGGQPPGELELAEQVHAALDLGELETAEDFLEATERGEDREHITVFQDDIDEGLYSNERLFAFGDSLFGHEFRLDDGLGASPSLGPLARVHTGVRGGLDTFSCAGCHSVGGPDGAGGLTQNALLEGDGDRAGTAIERNAPALLGLGFVQLLGLEMSEELQRQRRSVIEEARVTGRAASGPLVAKGIDFGMVRAQPGGAVDTSAVQGVASDLVVRPFGWKGTESHLRRFVEDAARVHFGIQSTVLAERNRTSPDPHRLGAASLWFDPDGDGKSREIEEGTLTATAVYLSMLESPVILPPNAPGLRQRWAQGSTLFDGVHCGSCHTRELPLRGSELREAPDTTDGPGVLVDLYADGEKPKPGVQVRLFSDLKRHDMGPGLADSRVGSDGVPRAVFLTRPLWGLAESAPYLHDGRATTIPEAILAHGGEAQASRDAFSALPAEAQADLHVFLLSLSRMPKPRVAR